MTGVMKIFTVGLDEKSTAKENEPSNTSPVLPPVISIDRRRSTYKGYMMCITTLFFVLLLAIIISEMAYNRVRDENFLRLKWAELKHRMGLGPYCDECMNVQRIAHSLHQQNRLEMSQTLAPITKGAESAIQAEPALDSADGKSKSIHGENRLGFLRDILERIREQAEKEGFDGSVQISVMKINPIENMPLMGSSFLDGFGEIKQPFMQKTSIFGQPSMKNSISSEENDDGNRMWHHNHVNWRPLSAMSMPNGISAPPSSPSILMGPLFNSFTGIDNNEQPWIVDNQLKNLPSPNFPNQAIRQWIPTVFVPPINPLSFNVRESFSPFNSESSAWFADRQSNQFQNWWADDVNQWKPSYKPINEWNIPKVNFNEPPITSWNTAQNFMQPNFPLGQTPQFQQQQKPLIPFPLQQSQDPLIPQPQGDFQQPGPILSPSAGDFPWIPARSLNAIDTPVSVQNANEPIIENTVQMPVIPAVPIQDSDSAKGFNSDTHPIQPVNFPLNGMPNEAESAMRQDLNSVGLQKQQIQSELGLEQNHLGQINGDSFLRNDLSQSDQSPSIFFQVDRPIDNESSSGNP